jgi:hypothetical protein
LIDIKAEIFSPATFLTMRLLAGQILALFALLASSAMSQAAMPVQECLAKADELEAGAMKKAPRGEEEAFRDFLKKTINDTRCKTGAHPPLS